MHSARYGSYFPGLLQRKGPGTCAQQKGGSDADENNEKQRRAIMTLRGSEAFLSQTGTFNHEQKRF